MRKCLRAKIIPNPYKVAVPNKIPPLKQLRAEDQFEIRELILRHALADDTRVERELARMLRPGYITGFPPKRIEFPLAVINGDEKSLAAALKTMNTTMRGKWNVRRIRKWYDERLTRNPRLTMTWQNCLDGTCSELCSNGWVISWWALAWLNIARWRGMTKIFQRPELFSEWIPLDLCI